MTEVQNIGKIDIKMKKGSFDWLEDYNSLKPTIYKLKENSRTKIIFNKVIQRIMKQNIM